MRPSGCSATAIVHLRTERSKANNDFRRAVGRQLTIIYCTGRYGARIGVEVILCNAL